jgi:hypothetical protein
MENSIKSTYRTIYPIIFCFNSLFSDSLQKGADKDFRQGLKNQGIDFIGSISYHLDANLAGGIKTGVINQGLIDLGFLFHSEKILKYPGGELFVNFEAHEGKNPSTELTGDLLIFDGMTAPNFVQLSEYWYKQKINKFSFIFGRINCSYNIAYTYNAQLLINNSYEAYPTILGYPTYPSPTPGLLFRYDWHENLNTKLGFFNGKEAINSFTEIYPFGLWEYFFQDLLIMAEIESHFNNKQGRIALGVTHNNTHNVAGYVFDEKIGYSGYFIGEYDFYEKYCCFVQGGVGNSRTVLFPFYLGGGVQINQLLPIDLTNILVLGGAAGFFTPKLPAIVGITGAEISLEATYYLEYLDFVFQPDFQYIIRPGGGPYPNAFVFVLNLEINL